MAGTPPMPSSVMAIGMSVCSANASTIGTGARSGMPLPARMSGRFAC